MTRAPLQPDPFEYAAVVVDFLAGDRVELRAVDGTPPSDPENGDAEYLRLRAILAAVRRLKRGNPDLRVYIA
jgi:hypothetical protein